MSQAHMVGKLFSWVIAVAALSLFYAGEALAACCKTSTGCSCNSLLSCPVGTTKVSSCSTSGGGLTLNGSEISCTSEEQTQVLVDRDSPETGIFTGGVGAIFTEIGRGITCTRKDDLGNLLGDGLFDLNLEYKMKAVAQCDNPSGLLTYAAFCGEDVKVKGTLKPSDGTLPAAFADMCTDSKDNIVSCDDPVLVLGGFQTDKKGFVDLNKCLSDFPNQSPTGLPAGQVLLYTEQYAPFTECTGPRIAASDAKRRACQDHTFYNPDYEATGSTTNPPCDPQPGGKVTFRAGISATDEADIKAALLYDNQWKPNSTLNLSCNNAGTVPTTVVNSENIAVSTFQLSTGTLTESSNTIVAFVQGKPEVFSRAISATPVFENGVAIGLRVTFPDCTGSFQGLDQVICQGIDSTNDPQTVNLSIRADQGESQGESEGLGFFGNALNVPINNAKANCGTLVPPLQ